MTAPPGASVDASTTPELPSATPEAAASRSASGLVSLPRVPPAFISPDRARDRLRTPKNVTVISS